MASSQHEPFTRACWLGDMAAVRELLAADATCVDFARPKDMARPTHVAAIRGHTDVLSYLLAHGAHVDARHSSGATPLALAAQEGHQPCVEVLLRAGAAVDAVTAAGASALFLAAQNDRPDVCRVLIRAGSNVELTDAMGATPLIAAAQNGHSETVRVLVREGNANLHARLGRKTVLECAVSRGREATAIVLVGLGAVALNVFDLDAGVKPAGARKQERKKELAAEARGVRKERAAGPGPALAPGNSAAKQLRQYQAEVERLQSELEDAKRTARAWRAAFIASLQLSKRDVADAGPVAGGNVGDVGHRE